MSGIEQDSPAQFPPVSELGPREKVAVWFAWALFLLCLALSVVPAVYWYRHSPGLPQFSGTKQSDDALLQSFRTQSEIVFDQVNKIFDLFVVKAFLPIFATIIGFLLGKHESGS